MSMKIEIEVIQLTSIQNSLNKIVQIQCISISSVHAKLVFWCTAKMRRSWCKNSLETPFIELNEEEGYLTAEVHFIFFFFV